MITAKVTPAGWEQLKEKLAAEGVLVSGNAGVIAEDGSRATYRFDGLETLTIQVTHAPFPLPESVVEGRIREGLVRAGVTVA